MEDLTKLVETYREKKRALDVLRSEGARLKRQRDDLDQRYRAAESEASDAYVALQRVIDGAPPPEPA